MSQTSRDVVAYFLYPLRLAACPQRRKILDPANKPREGTEDLCNKDEKAEIDLLNSIQAMELNFAVHL
jgi:hypothetical protein